MRRAHTVLIERLTMRPLACGAVVIHVQSAGTPVQIVGGADGSDRFVAGRATLRETYTTVDESMPIGRAIKQAIKDHRK